MGSPDLGWSGQGLPTLVGLIRWECRIPPPLVLVLVLSVVLALPRLLLLLLLLRF